MPVPYYGDFPEDATIDLPFNTFTSNDPSASCTITDFINTDVHIHKAGGLAQRNNAAGITVSVDFDGITGNHLVKIDTSDNTVAGFWVTGAEYQVRIEGVTVDGATLNIWIGAFSIERTGGALALLKNGTYGLSAIETLVDDLESRLTVVRAGYLDNLSVGAVALSSVCTEARLNRLDAAISSRSSHADPTAAIKGAPGKTNQEVYDNELSVSDIFTGIIEGTITFEQLQRILLARAAGKADGGGGTTINFRDQADTKDRITMTVDPVGDRASVIVDGS